MPPVDDVRRGPLEQHVQRLTSGGSVWLEAVQTTTSWPVQQNATSPSLVLPPSLRSTMSMPAPADTCTPALNIWYMVSACNWSFGA